MYYLLTIPIIYKQTMMNLLNMLAESKKSIQSTSNPNKMNKKSNKWILNGCGKWIKKDNFNKCNFNSSKLLGFNLGEDIDNIICGFKCDLEQQTINIKNRKSICNSINMVCYGNFTCPPHLRNDFNYYRTTIMDKDSVDFWTNENKINLDNMKLAYKTLGNIKYHKENNIMSCVYSNKNNQFDKRKLEIYGNQREGCIYSLKLSVKLLDKLDSGNQIVIGIKGFEMKDISYSVFNTAYGCGYGLMKAYKITKNVFDETIGRQRNGYIISKV